LLPWLKNKQGMSSGISIKQRDSGQQLNEKPEDKDASIHACAKDLIDAVHSQDTKAAAEAIRSAFEILDSEPHEEGPHIEPHSYDSQKED
jgi:hypothetical protein